MIRTCQKCTGTFDEKRNQARVIGSYPCATLRTLDGAREETMIYFVGCGTSGPIKIGHTEGSTVWGRLSALQSGCPQTLVPIFTMPGDHEREQGLHAMFWGERHRGEWFCGTNRVRQFVMDLVCGLENGNVEHHPEGRYVWYGSESGSKHYTVRNGRVS